MKLIERLSLLYARNNTAIKYGHEDIVKAYMAGFRTARDMYSGELVALELAPGTYEIGSKDWRELENLGEDEV